MKSLYSELKMWRWNMTIAWCENVHKKDMYDTHCTTETILDDYWDLSNKILTVNQNLQIATIPG